MFLKGLIAAAFESSELLHLLRLNGCVVATLHRQSTDSLIAGLWPYLVIVPNFLHAVQ